MITVTSSSSDTLPPELLAFQLSPTRVEDGSQVALQVTATDDLSGVKGIDGWVVSPNKVARIHFSLRAAESQDEYLGTVKVPKKAANGVWHVERLSLSDRAGNRALVTSSDTRLTSATFEVYSLE